jgi:hypothetical protein
MVRATPAEHEGLAQQIRIWDRPENQIQINTYMVKSAPVMTSSAEVGGHRGQAYIYHLESSQGASVRPSVTDLGASGVMDASGKSNAKRSR